MIIFARIRNILYSDIHIIPLQNVVNVVAPSPNVTIAVSLQISLQSPVLRATCCASTLEFCYIFPNDMLTGIDG